VRDRCASLEAALGKHGSGQMIRVACLIAAATLMLALCNCAVPLAPAYKITKETREIDFIAGPPAAIQIHDKYELQNYGVYALDHIDVTLPDPATYGRTDTKAELDGQATELQQLPGELQDDRPDEFRIAFASPWKPKEKHQIEVEFTLWSPAKPGSWMTLSDSDFHIEHGAFAALQAPDSVMAPFPSRPAKTIYSVRVPEDFRVLARGTLDGKPRRAGNEAEYRYRLNANDLGIFVVAGRYSESAPLGKSGAIFWTLQPMNIDANGARAITEAWTTLQKDFGPLGRPGVAWPHIVEATGLREHISGGQTIAAAAFPGGALVNDSALEQGTGSDAFIEAVSHALAHNWFGQQVYAAPDADLTIGEGLPEYAMLAIDEARGGEAARRRRIERYLSAYDEAVKQGPELTLAAARLSDPPAERRIALAKAPLFFAALEDECGSAAMQSGLKEMVALMRGQTVGYPVLRSALEQASGKDLAATFRLWLDHKGIPGEFRDRYRGS